MTGGHEVFSASRAAHLDSRLRTILFRPDHLMKRYVQPGDRVLDIGCGPGMFTRAAARRVGDKGQVIAVDMQEEMLQMLRARAESEGLLSRIRTHQAAPDSLLLNEPGSVDIAMAIYVVHEVPDPSHLFQEVAALLVPQGRFLLVEPFMVVSGKEFQEELELASRAGFRVEEHPFLLFSRAVLLRKG
jgi:ubiquinone/menaquinone biosynthesis C-methylase UbiE